MRRRDDFEILLINKENYFVFQPMLAEVVSGSIGILDTVSPIRRMLRKTDLHVREIESIDTLAQTVTTTPGFSHQVLPPELVQLKINSSQSVVHEHFEPGQEVFREGDIGDRLYIITSGKAEVIRKNGAGDIPLAQLGAGEYFGEMALLNHTTRNATVRCVESLDVLSIPKREFSALAATLPTMRENLERVMAQRKNTVPN